MVWLALLPFLLLSRMQIAYAQFGIVNNKTKDGELTPNNVHGNRDDILAMFQQRTKDEVEKTTEKARKQFEAANSTKIAGVSFVRPGHQELQATIDMAHESDAEQIQKKDLEMICDALAKIARDAIELQSKLTPDEHKKQLFWFLKKLKREGIYKVYGEYAEKILRKVLDNGGFMHAMLEETEIEEIKENTSKFIEEVEASLSELIFELGLGDTIDTILDDAIAKVAETYPEDIVATFRDFFLFLEKIADDLRLLDPQDPNFDFALEILILRHVMVG